MTPRASPSQSRVSMRYLRLIARDARAPDPRRDACFDAFQGEVDYLLRTFRRLGASPSEIEDLCQEVFLALRRTWTQYDPERPLRPYLFGLAFRVASWERRRWWREVPQAFIEIDVEDESPDLALEDKEKRAILMAALQRVPLARRAVLIMHDIDGVPMHDVAAALAIPRFTAYSRLRKARRELAKAARRLMKEGS